MQWASNSSHRPYVCIQGSSNLGTRFPRHTCYVDDHKLHPFQAQARHKHPTLKIYIKTLLLTYKALQPSKLRIPLSTENQLMCMKSSHFLKPTTGSNWVRKLWPHVSELWPEEIESESETENWTCLRTENWTCLARLKDRWVIISWLAGGITDLRMSSLVS